MIGQDILDLFADLGDVGMLLAITLIIWLDGTAFPTIPERDKDCAQPGKLHHHLQRRLHFDRQGHCNNFSGTYSQQNGFTIKLGPTTMASCGEASLDQQYLQLLGSVAAGGPNGAGGLALETAGGAQRMLFMNGGPAPIDPAIYNQVPKTTTFGAGQCQVVLTATAPAYTSNTIGGVPSGEIQAGTYEVGVAAQYSTSLWYGLNNVGTGNYINGASVSSTSGNCTLNQ